MFRARLLACRYVRSAQLSAAPPTCRANSTCLFRRALHRSCEEARAPGVSNVFAWRPRFCFKKHAHTQIKLVAKKDPTLDPTKPDSNYLKRFLSQAALCETGPAAVLRGEARKVRLRSLNVGGSRQRLRLPCRLGQASDPAAAKAAWRTHRPCSVMLSPKAHLVTAARRPSKSALS